MPGLRMAGAADEALRHANGGSQNDGVMPDTLRAWPSDHRKFSGALHVVAS